MKAQIIFVFGLSLFLSFGHDPLSVFWLMVLQPVQSLLHPWHHATVLPLATTFRVASKSHDHSYLWVPVAPSDWKTYPQTLMCQWPRWALHTHKTTGKGLSQTNAVLRNPKKPSWLGTHHSKLSPLQAVPSTRADHQLHWSFEDPTFWQEVCYSWGHRPSRGPAAT